MVVRNALYSLTSYDCRVEADVSYREINFVVLDSGVAVQMVDDGELSLFSSKKDSLTLKKIEDKSITSDMELCKHGGRLAAILGNRAYTLKMNP